MRGTPPNLVTVAGKGKLWAAFSYRSFPPSTALLSQSCTYIVSDPIFTSGWSMKKTRISLVTIASTLVIGCASNQYPVTYDSNPKGAEVYCNETSYGYTPVTLNYTLDEQTKKNGVLRTAPCVVKWVSGASGPLHTVIDIRKFPNGAISTTSRPNEPNAQVDHQFALQLESVRAQQQQARAARDSAAAALWSAWSANMPKSVNCTTTPIGNSVYTNCR